MMGTRRRGGWIALAVLTALAWADQSMAADERLVSEGRAFLAKYCHDCHGGANDVGEDLNVLDREAMLKRPESPDKKPYLVPGKPGESLIWEYAGVGPDYRMPKKRAPQPTPEERQVLERWILAGAEFPRAEARKAVEPRAKLEAIKAHLDRLAPADRPFRRYLTLDYLHNNPTVADDAIRTHRAAASKLLNSLSWQPEIVVPESIDGPNALVLAVDLRKLGWEPDDWKAIVRAYPYGVSHPDDSSTRSWSARSPDSPGPGCRRCGPTGSWRPSPVRRCTTSSCGYPRASATWRRSSASRWSGTSTATSCAGGDWSAAGSRGTTGWSSGTRHRSAPTGGATTLPRATAWATCSCSRSAPDFPAIASTTRRSSRPGAR